MTSSTTATKRLASAWAVEDASSAKKGRGPRKASVQALADKAILDNCKNMEPDELDQIFIGGLTLRERVYRDKQLKEDKGPSAPKIGKKYWQDLRGMYMNPNRIEKQLVPDDRLSLCPALVTALAYALKGHANRSHIQSHMSRVKKVNQRECVLLLRYLCQLEPSASSDQLNTCVSIMEGLHRIGAPASFAEEFALTRAKFDQIATQAGWTHASCHLITHPVWCRSRGFFWGVFVISPFSFQTERCFARLFFALFFLSKKKGGAEPLGARVTFGKFGHAILDVWQWTGARLMFQHWGAGWGLIAGFNAP